MAVVSYRDTNRDTNRDTGQRLSHTHLVSATYTNTHSAQQALSFHVKALGTVWHHYHQSCVYQDGTTLSCQLHVFMSVCVCFVLSDKQMCISSTLLSPDQLHPPWPYVTLHFCSPSILSEHDFLFLFSYNKQKCSSLSLTLLPCCFTLLCSLTPNYSINTDWAKAEKRCMQRTRKGRWGRCSLIDSSFWLVDLHSASCKGQVSTECECVPLYLCMYVCPLCEHQCVAANWPLSILFILMYTSSSTIRPEWQKLL